MLTILIPQSVSAQDKAQDKTREKTQEKAREKDQDKRFYITAKPGIYSPQTSDLEGFDTGFYGEVAAGYKIIKYFATELGVGYFHTEGSESAAGVIGGFNFGATAKATLNVLPVTFTAKLIIPYKKWEFFGLGGVGAYFVWADFKVNGFVDGIFFNGKIKGNDTIFGGYAGGGVHYNITRSVFVGAEGKYLWTDHAKFEDSGVSLRTNLDGIVATAVLGFRF